MARVHKGQKYCTTNETKGSVPFGNISLLRQKKYYLLILAGTLAQRGIMGATIVSRLRNDGVKPSGKKLLR